LQGSHFMRFRCTFPGARETLDHELAAKEEAESTSDSVRDGFALVSVGVVLCMERILLFFRLPQFLTSRGDSFRLPLRPAAEAHV
jgi:hypothetical protein